MTYAGELSFLRRRYTRSIDNADVVVSGIPFDSATSFRPGARFGPQAIRAASVQLAEIAGRAFPFDLDLFAELAVADYGDCELDYGYPAQAVSAIEAHARRILASGCTMLTFGGDHFVTYPLLRAHAERFGPLALVHFDAHVDTWDDDGERLDHGTMFLRAKEQGLIDVAGSVQVGIRSFSQRDHGFTIIDAPTVHERGSAAVVQQILATVGNRPAYLTFDIDCLDPAFAPGTGTPVPGGLSSAQALAIIRGLGALTLVGMDIVEVAPAYDHAELTALAAANLGHDLLCLLALKRRDQR
ncbi:MAG: agmatinase [Pseudomonadota bacterium]